jgi:outer membrane protein assembly factor BamB
VPRQHGARIPEHGMTGSPLAVDGLVVVSAGGPDGHSLVAYDQESGEPVWHGGDDGAAYASPTLVTLAGRRQIVAFNQSSVAGHDPADGSVLWSYPWPASWPNVATPLVVGDDRLIASTGYGIGSKLLRVRPDGGGGPLAAELVWETPRLKSKFANLAFHAGFVYGLDDGVLVCLDPENGARRWKGGRYGHGNLLIVGDLLLVQTERGEMALVEAMPDQHRELGRFLALRGKAWNPFALAGRHLLVRNDAEAALWELPLAHEPDS